MRLLHLAPLAAGLCLGTGCATFGPLDASLGTATASGDTDVPLAVLQNATGPLSFSPPTDAAALRNAREVHGESCRIGVQLPLPAPNFWLISWGNGGYVEAMRDLQNQAPGMDLYDVRVDLNHMLILFLYREDCLRITAQATPHKAP